jgi:hypothetical protein
MLKIVVLGGLLLSADSAQAKDAGWCGQPLNWDGTHIIVRSETGQRLILTRGENSKYVFTILHHARPPRVCWDLNEDYVPLPRSRPR